KMASEFVERKDIRRHQAGSATSRSPREGGAAIACRQDAWREGRRDVADYMDFGVRNRPRRENDIRNLRSQDFRCPSRQPSDPGARADAVSVETRPNRDEQGLVVSRWTVAIRPEIEFERPFVAGVEESLDDGTH